MWRTTVRRRPPPCAR
eukprot:gene9608-biopygen4874